MIYALFLRQLTDPEESGKLEVARAYLKKAREKRFDTSHLSGHWRSDSGACSGACVFRIRCLCRTGNRLPRRMGWNRSLRKAVF